MGHLAHPGRRRAVVAAAAVSAGAVVAALTIGGQPLAAAATVLHGVVDVTVVHPDGSSVAGSEGLRLRPGDVVRTGPAGRTDLVTRSRSVYVGSSAAVQVLDGARQVLRSGAAVVDAVDGPGVDLQVAGLDVAVAGGTAVRAERGVTIRLGALLGTVSVSSATGRHLSVSALHQTMAAGDALPGFSTPLQLTDDDGEARAVPDLVRDDQTLRTLASGIDRTGTATARVIDAAWHGSLAAPPGVVRSDRLLPALIAAAGPVTGVQQRYALARSLRAAGGSWGVVAHLVGVQGQDVVAALASFERRQPAGHIGSVRAILAAAGGSTPGGGQRPPGGHRGPSGSPGTHHSRPPVTRPPPTQDPVGQLVHTVNRTVRRVLHLVPTHPPVPELPVPVPTLSVPLPLPTAQASIRVR